MTDNDAYRYKEWEFVGWLSALVPDIDPADDVRLYRRRETGRIVADETWLSSDS